MSSTLYKSVMILLFVWLFYQIFNSWMLLVFLMMALLFLFLYKTSPGSKEAKSHQLWTSIILFIASIVFTNAFWAIISVFLVVEMNTDSKLSRTIRDPLFRRKQYWREKEFVSVEWDDQVADESRMKFSKNKWVGDDSVGKDVFQWDDKNFIKIMGDTFFDLGNTIIPKRENTIIMRKGFGDTKIIVPKDIALSLDISMALGKLVIDKEEYDLKNETVKWQSENYTSSIRKLRIVSNTLVGEVEVIYL
ncbi:MAG: cell wall-active antibiotics response protein [Alkalibacterium sp.]|nr:cell wall-active antibiotics response protein [Alkalibacterium sp.]